MENKFLKYYAYYTRSKFRPYKYHDFKVEDNKVFLTPKIQDPILAIWAFPRNKIDLFLKNVKTTQQADALLSLILAESSLIKINRLKIFEELPMR